MKYSYLMGGVVKGLGEIATGIPMANGQWPRTPG